MEETVVSYQSSVRQPKQSPSLLESSVMTFSKVISLDRPKQFQRYNDGCLFRNTKLSIDSRSLPIKTTVITKKYYNSIHSITRGTIRLSFFLFFFFLLRATFEQKLAATRTPTRTQPTPRSIFPTVSRLVPPLYS